MSLMSVALPAARARRGLGERVWGTLAYCARYGKQPLDVLHGMTLSELATFSRAVSDIVREENAPPKER